MNAPLELSADIDYDVKLYPQFLKLAHDATIELNEAGLKEVFTFDAWNGSHRGFMKVTADAEKLEEAEQFIKTYIARHSKPIFNDQGLPRGRGRC